ncbi:MAG: rhodanese-like domain-containing protein [Candidatus Didemnitutus sp.]|nr:rhodanese-like domain-containing protein [Candidatus Didemnitutus sp.]
MTRPSRRPRRVAVLLLLALTATATLFGMTRLRHFVFPSPVTWDEVRWQIAENFPSVPQLGTTELAAMLGDPAGPRPLLIDTRAAREYAVSHLPGALHAEMIEDVRRLLATAPRDQAVVLYCSVGWRSSRLAADLLQADPARSVHNLDGSLFQWANEGRPLVTPDGTPTHRAHPYDQRWGRLLDARLHAENPRP